MTVLDRLGKNVIWKLFVLWMGENLPVSTRCAKTSLKNLEDLKKVLQCVLEPDILGSCSDNSTMVSLWRNMLRLNPTGNALKIRILTDV